MFSSVQLPSISLVVAYALYIYICVCVCVLNFAFLSKCFNREMELSLPAIIHIADKTTNKYILLCNYRQSTLIRMGKTDLIEIIL
jgi:hypothetical protein